VVGCIGARSRGGAPERPRSVELCKLYVAREARRRGLGGALCALVEEEARARGAKLVELWSDTRFKDAHRLYERRGYARGPETRELHDRSGSVEYFFRLDLSGKT
jgi:putative acetyltransferase